MKDVLTIKEMQQEARNALAEARLSQSEAARELDVSRSTVNKALNLEDPSRYANMLRQLISAYTDYEVGETSLYRVQQKGK